MVERRLKWLAWIVAAWGVVIFLKLVSLQVLHHREYANMARARQELVVEISGPRGTLFDRSGQVLAMSAPTESVYINPLKVPDLGLAAQILSAELHLDRAELYGAMQLAHDNHRGFLWIKHRLSYDESQHIKNLNLDWIFLQHESQRHYPNGTLAAHLLGGVDFEEKGNGGIERALEPDLKGVPGKMRLLTDVRRRGIDSHLASEPRAGAPVILTIDAHLQFVAERELAAAVEAHNAVSGSLVVMNPYTGDILAMASYPTYDPNLPPQPGDPIANRQNHAVGVPFEPGSVFKVITLSAALETTNLRPESPIDCHLGVLKLPGRVIHDSHVGLYGVLPMEMAFAKSSNIGAIMVGMRVGQENMYDYMRRFGFGQKTGIALPGESAGKVRSLARWGTTSLASVSMGQEVSVTTVQLAEAGSVVANGGLLVRPRLVLKKSGQTVPPVPPVRILKPETAITMRQMMEGVVLHGTGSGARIQGYTVGGKTGTAQIYDFIARHYTHTYNGSFMGFAPVTNPAVVVVVSLNGTHGTAGFGGPVAAPVFKVVAAEALRVLDVPKDLPDDGVQIASATEDVSDLADADLSAAGNILEEADDDTQVAEAHPVPTAGPVASVAPAPPDTRPRVPNFSGMTMRAVLAEAAAKGIAVVPAGSGIAHMQSPPPGAILHEGERIRVQFSR
jgi:cell division protein FtsI (penicillin-binding protein 3)